MSKVRNRKKTLFSPSRVVAVIVVLIAAVIFYPIVTGSRVDKDKLYKQARTHMNTQDYKRAVGPLKKIVDVDPNYKDAQKKLTEAKKGLYDQAKNSADAGDLENAESRLVALSDTDPNYKDVPKQIKAVKKKQADEANEPNTSGGDNDPSGDESPTDGGGAPDNGGLGPKEIADDAVPVDLLPQSMAGYKIIQNGWLIQPYQAGTTFIPRDRAVRQEIDRIILTLAKHEGMQDAKDRYDSEKEIFAVESQDININNHSAYSGLYNESKPKVYPPIARLMWTRQQWFFSVDVLSKGSPSSSFKRQIAEDVVEKLLY